MTGLKNWVMVTLTLIFVVLYAAALLGWLKPLSDVTMVMRLEPIIFTIIGYYFGRLPAQQNEETLKDEIKRQTDKADSAQISHEQAQQEREALEEKLKNVRTVLSVAGTRDSSKTRLEKSVVSDESDAELIRHSLKTAVNILNS